MPDTGWSATGGIKTRGDVVAMRSSPQVSARPLPWDGRPLPFDLRFIQGLRAVSSIGVAVLHTYMLWQFFLPHATKYELTRSNLLVKAASAGDEAGARCPGCFMPKTPASCMQAWYGWTCCWSSAPPWRPGS